MKIKSMLGLALAASMLAVPAISTQDASARTTKSYVKKNKKKGKKSSKKACCAYKNVSVANLFADNVGKYPYEIQLLKNTELRQRLIKLMGEKAFNAMEKNFQVVGPIEKSGNVYSVWGGQTHNAGCTNATISYNPDTNLLVVDTNVDCNTQQQYAEN